MQEASDLTLDLTSTLRLSVPSGAAARAAARAAAGAAAGATAAVTAVEILVRVPGWLAQPCKDCVHLNGVPLEGTATPGSYFKVAPPWADGAWRDGDLLSLHFAPTLWTAPLNDYHPEHNATLAFMFGPLVLAGTHMDNDVFVPRGGAARARSRRRTLRRGLVFLH